MWMIKLLMKFVRIVELLADNPDLATELSESGRKYVATHFNRDTLAQDYLSWHGFIEAALVLGDEPAVWENIRWINGMAWELQVKARPQEVYPNQNEALAQPITDAITAKWQGRSQEEIAVEFENYRLRPVEWLS